MVLLCILMAFPPNLESSQMKLKAGFGFSLSGKVEDEWVMATNFFDLDSSRGEKTNLPLDVSLELVFQFNPNFGISIGTGYISKGLNGSGGRFSFPAGSSLSGNFSYTPYFVTNICPVFVSAIWTYPVMLEGEVFVLGGAGYYFGRISCASYDSENNIRDPENQWNYLPWLYKSDIGSLGYHGGIGFAYEVSDRSSLFIEAVYRVVNIKNLDTVNRDIDASGIYGLLGDEIKRLGDKSTFMYAQRFGGEEAWGDIDYRITKLSYSGLSLRVGIIFKF